jgi:succinate dehydrogenase flavin-adding protein (antitoxin of CptAB toxin-antitoxin module)
MLQDFLAQRYVSLTPPEQQAFDLLLETPDVTLLAYLQGDQDPPDKALVEIVAKIRQ